MLLDIVLLFVSFLVIIAGAEIFTNGVEWLGVRLRLSEGAVGSVLAGVGTALPETTIPFVALVFFTEKESQEIGLGAILGAPFMLATLAFFVTALSAWVYRRRRENGWRLRVNRHIVTRDLGFFLPLYASGIAASFLPDAHHGRFLVAAALIVVYVYYAYLNLRESGKGEKEEPLMLHVVWSWLPLIRPVPNREEHLARREAINGAEPRLRLVAFQVLLALCLIMAGAYKFVGATQEICILIGFSPLIFALIVAPIATELPEKLNSVIWVRQGKDTLALGNITGAMVFQATFPVTVGILLTPWNFRALPTGDAALLSAGIALASGLLVLVRVRSGRSQTMTPWPLAVGLLGWLLFVGYVFVAR